jgi:uncharacterized membrane protein
MALPARVGLGLPGCLAGASKRGLPKPAVRDRAEPLATARVDRGGQQMLVHTRVTGHVDVPLELAWQVLRDFKTMPVWHVGVVGVVGGCRRHD